MLVCFGVQSHLDVVVVLQAVLHVVEEGEDVESVQAAVQQSVHALERSLPQVQTVIHCVFEGTHLHLRPQTRHRQTPADEHKPTSACSDFSLYSRCSHLSDQLLPDFGLVVQLW